MNRPPAEGAIAMPLLPLISFIVVAAIWLAVLLEVVSNGFGPGQHLWIELFVLLGFPLLAYRAYLRIRAARGAARVE